MKRKLYKSDMNPDEMESISKTERIEQTNKGQLVLKLDIRLE